MTDEMAEALVHIGNSLECYVPGTHHEVMDDIKALLMLQRRECPLRELEKWISKGPCFQVELFQGKTSGFAVGCEDATDEDHCTCVAYGDGETLIDAAADAVKQLKEKGEL